MRGFTTVKDAGGNCFALKKATDQRLAKGPRIYPGSTMILQEYYQVGKEAISITAFFIGSSCSEGLWISLIGHRVSMVS